MLVTSSTEHGDVPSDIRGKSRSKAMTCWLLLRYLLTKIGSIRWQESLQPRVLFSWDDAATRRSTDTAWLDGLRGIACMQVVLFHFFGRYIPWQRTYGSSDEDYYIYQLPIFRSIWGAGPSAVCVFFVISGYAITVKCLTLLRRRDLEELYKSLASSLIRRGFRLYMPIFVLAIPILFLIRMVPMHQDGYIYEPERKETLTKQFIHLFNATDDLVNPFMYPEYNPSGNRYAYIPVSWTIPMEYQASIVAYLMVLIVSRIQVYRIRAFIVGGMAFYSLHRGCWWVSNFMVGMMLADHVLEQESQKESVPQSFSTTRHRWQNVAYYAVFFCGYYLAGLCPEVLQYDFNPTPKPGYQFLYTLYPPYTLFRMLDLTRWWWYWSSNFTVFAISQLPRLRKICESHFCQWLGKLSYSLYLVHAAVIGALSTPIESMVKDFTNNKFVLCLVEFSLIIPISFVLAGMAEQYVDKPSIRFARYVEKYISQERCDEGDETLLSSSAMAIEMEQRLPGDASGARA